jgi:PEP-CTERM motif
MVRVGVERQYRRNWLSLGLVCAAALISPAMSRAQVSLFNSNGFESPTFATGILGSYYIGGTGGQQGFLTTDFNQFLGAPAGTIQSGTVFAGSQAFQIHGPGLFDDGTFSGQSFWYRNYPTAATAFNPVLSGTPIVRMTFNQYITSTPLNLTEMPLVGVYMEGFTPGDATGAIGGIYFNLNGGMTAITVGGNAVSTANGLVSHDAWHNLTVDFNFSTQTYRAFVDGNLLTFGASLNNVPFRSTFNRVSEYGFQASYNEATMSTTNDAYFDNLVVIGVPEPSSFVLGGVALLGLRFVRRRRK